METAVGHPQMPPFQMGDMQQQHIPSGAAINTMPGNNISSDLDNLINNLPGVDQAMSLNGQLEGAMPLDVDQSLYLSSLDSNLESLLKSGDQADSGELVRLLTDANGILAGQSEHGASLGFPLDPMQQDPNLNRNQQWS